MRASVSVVCRKLSSVQLQLFSPSTAVFDRFSVHITVHSERRKRSERSFKQSRSSTVAGVKTNFLL